MTIQKCFAILLVLSVAISECLGNRVIETSAGNFRGAASSDGTYFEFLGIPYGQVNADNPFGVASAYPAISGIFEADDDSARCPQDDGNGNIFGSLDCLRLNVFIPSTATVTSQLPVMVYVHGGFFHRGHVSRQVIGPKFLVQHDVILVAVTYRTGPYGFMCLNRRGVPGNQGLKDQTLALKWVKNNIGAFGGDANKVTLFGHSAGAHSVDFHLLSEQEKLYNNVIIQSGSSFAQTVNYEPDREAPIKLASYLGLEHSTVGEALRSLRDAPTNDVIRAAIQLDIQFKPCAETKFDDVEPFLTKFWVDSPVPKAQGLPIMIGFAEYERLMTHINVGSEHFQTIANLVHNSLNHTFNLDEEKMDRMKGHMRRFYLGDDAMSQDTVWQISNFESDFLYIYPIQRSIKKFVEAGASNIFYYMFSYTGGRNEAAIENANVQAAVHSDDIRYLFDIASMPPQISTQDQIMIDRMTTMWTNFAKYSDPTPTQTTLLPIKWTPLTSSTYHYLKIDANLSMARRPLNRRMAFWDLFLKINGDEERRYEAAIAAEDDDDNINASVAVTSSVLNMMIALTLLAAYGH